MNYHKERIKLVFKNSVLFKKLRTSELFRKYIWYYYLKVSSKKRLLKEAREKFSIEKPRVGSLIDYQKALNKNLVSYSEYMHQYEFYRLSEKQRKEFVSRLEMRLWYQRNINSYYIENLFWNKANWLNHFKEYIHRNWIDPVDLTYTKFKTLIEPTKQYIIKPKEGSLGIGISKIQGNTITPKIFEELCTRNYIIEELISNEPSIAAFHPASLNTIRITSLRTGDIIGSFIRFGNHGNVVDNAHAGGIFAQIDIEKGQITTNGIDTNGNIYIVHPYSNKPIKGFQIPKWTEIRKIIKNLHNTIPKAAVVGWDICVTNDGNIEIIEGNHLPDVDVLQSPQKKGIRNRLSQLLKDAQLPEIKL